MSKLANCRHHLREPAIDHRPRTRAAVVALSPTAGTASPVRMAPRAVRFTLANPARSFAATAVVLRRSGDYRRDALATRSHLEGHHSCSCVSLFSEVTPIAVSGHYRDAESLDNRQDQPIGQRQGRP